MPGRISMPWNFLKVAKYELQKLVALIILFCCTFWSMFRVFHLAWSTWPVTKTLVAGWRDAACWLVDLLEHEKICCATKPKFVAKIDPHSTFRPNVLQPQQMFLLRDKLTTQGEKRETSTKTCSETMLRDKLREIVSRILPLLARICLGNTTARQRENHSHHNFYRTQPVKRKTEIKSKKVLMQMSSNIR